MMINLETIPKDGYNFDFTLEPAWWQNDDSQILGFDSPFKVHICISRAGNDYVLDGRMAGRLKIRCDRCLGPYFYDLESEFKSLLSLRPLHSDQTELELLEEDLSVDFITGNEIDLDDVVISQLYLSLPIQLLCKEDCPGLCPDCGVDLNRERCNCREEKKDSPFMKLKKMMASQRAAL